MMDTRDNPFDGERIARGCYRYAEGVREIDLVRYPFDFHLELLDPEARAGLLAQPVNPDGYLFYLVPAETEPLPEAFQSVEAAMAWADLQPWGPVTWNRRADAEEVSTRRLTTSSACDEAPE